MKLVFVTGGVLSSLGKGITSASIGLLLKSRGLRVSIIKIDPYLNYDAGTMNPYQHGEVFVTDDGGETDLDIGHYERFLNEDLSKRNNLTAGQVYLEVIERERQGKYLGATVQVVPHLTDLIKERIREVAREYDVTVVEIGGTVGDIESLPFLEAARQMGLEESSFYLHVSYVPFVKSIGEIKTKPTQHSVQKLREIGIQPDALIARGEKPLTPEARKKLALFSSLPLRAVVGAHDLENVYRVPFLLAEQNLDDLIFEKLGLGIYTDRSLEAWENFVERVENSVGEVSVGIVGKYIEVRDAYKSLIEAVIHAGAHLKVKPKVELIDAIRLEREGTRNLKDYDALIIAGGFGERGIEGKISAISFARKNSVPILGICLGMQLMTVEWARNVLKLKDAHSEEFQPNTPHPVIHLLPDQKNIDRLGATMRLGGQEVSLREGLTRKLYGKEIIRERHRHRYEFNNAYRDSFEKSGLQIVGETRGLVEVIEWAEHPFYVGVQFHPEYTSRPLNPGPLFVGLLKAALDRK
ncbi:MAG: CTP synthase [Thermotogae bacterium]|nr:CTP synthase [Thermotogota bacterium]